MRLLQHLAVLLSLLLVALPFLWLAYAAFLPKEAVYSGSLFGFGFSLENVRALEREGFWGRLLFSLGLSLGVTLLQLLTAFLAAYALRMGLGFLLPLYLFLMAVPAELLLVPLYGLLKSLGLLETLLALILPFAASPFVIYLAYQAMRGVPEELLEAARLDGAGHRALLLHILLPLVRPALVAGGVLAFAAHWNLVLYPRVMVSDPRLWTVQTWLTDLQRKYPTDWGLLAASALLAILPLALLYLAFERKVTVAFEEGMKG